MPSATLERLGGADSSEAEDSCSSPTRLKRVRYLQRVVDSIQAGRLSWAHSYRTASKNNSESPDPSKSVSSDTSQGSSKEEPSSKESGGGEHSPTAAHFHHKKRASSTFIAAHSYNYNNNATKFHHGQENGAHFEGRGDSIGDRSGGDVGGSGRHSTGLHRKVPKIKLKSPSVDSSVDYAAMFRRGPRSPGMRQLSGSGGRGRLGSGDGGAGGGGRGGGGIFGPRPPSPMVPKREPGDLFSWQICNPTNWKRGKSDRQILLERKMLRRKGKQPSSQSMFISVFKLKDPRKLTAADRIRRVLRRAQFYGDDIKRLPLVRFRRAVRTLIALLKTVKLTKDKGKGTEPSTWIDEDDIRASRKAYEMFGVTFDVYSFRARREIQLTNESKAILSMAPGTRSEEQLHVALVSLSQAVPEFGEFPIAMQEALVKVGWYENFEARRIIIREGHMADNFYLILSGSAVVTIREQNPAGEYFGRTVAVLQRGNSFGELALIYGGTRSATVTCKDNVELLAVGRDDYIDIFMHKSRDGAEPEHLKFLKQIKLFCGWPIQSLPLDDPSIFLYTYVRRGMVLCKDSNQSEWIYVIKSGSCRVLTALQPVKSTLPCGDPAMANCKVKLEMDGHQHSPRLTSPRLCPLRPREREHQEKPRDRHVTVTTTCPAHTLSRAFKLPAIRTDLEVQESALKHEQELDEILRKRNLIQPTLVTEMTHSSSEDLHGPVETSKQSSAKSDKIFVNLLTLQAKDVYGLESVVLSVFKEPTRTSLVSDGAECIMISKKFFQQKLSEEVAKKIRKEIRPLPSEEVLQEKLQTKTDWDTFRALTVADFVEFRKQLQSLHYV